ncbi:MAG: MFS transporter [Clostridia bacterium]
MEIYVYHGQDSTKVGVKMEQEKIAKFNRIFPWYAGLSRDLLFWIAIDTLFLTVVKNLNASQIVSLSSISSIVCIVLQIPLLKIIRKIGNTKSVRLSSLLLLISSLLLTFGQNYVIIALGMIIYEMAFTFQNMANAVLKNNLELQNKNNEYIKVKTKSNTIYAIVTMIISFIASLMFNLNSYLPMYGCITICLICFILSFYIVDYSKYNKIKEKTKIKSKKKINYNKLIILLIISYGFFYPIVNSGQSNGKLFIQQELLLNFDVEKTALIIGAILCISRIVRVISNIAFNKIHDKYEEKVGVILSILLSISIIFMILGSFVQNSVILKFSIMSLGYIIILFIRDPFKVYMQDLALRNVGKEGQQSLLATMELARRIVSTIISLSFTMILANNSMIIVIVILFILSIIGIAINIKLYKLILVGKKIKSEESNNRNF